MNDSKIIPKILHRSHPDFTSLKYPKDEFRLECNQMHRNWEIKEWTDTDIDQFVRTKYPKYYQRFSEMQPIIRRVDAVRYLWMHYFGGAYLDMDVECIRPMDSLIDSLPKGNTAWGGGYLEPFVMISTPGNYFWIYAFEQILRDWRKYNVRSTGGPQGLARMVKNYVNDYGLDAVRLFSISDKDVADGIYPYGDVVAGEETWRWIESKEQFKESKVPVEHKVGFFPGSIFDPTACLQKIGSCRWTHCHERKDEYIQKAYTVHHCMFSWKDQAKG
jgi:hypothetical protein